MHTQQTKTQSPGPATKTAEPTHKAASSAVSPTRIPAWASAWRDQPPFGLLLPGERIIPGVQTKLSINQAEDSYEEEPDQIMRTPASSSAQHTCACCGIAGPTGECAECAAKRKALQRKATHQASMTTGPSLVTDVLNSSRGRPLDAATRSFMEPRFGHDFSNVRVHTDERAIESAQAVNAKAYTVGRDVVFGAGQYEPGTSEGQRLLAHELTHVVQQQKFGGTSQPATALSKLGSPAEVEAEIAAHRVVANLPAQTITARPIAMQREEASAKGKPSERAMSRPEEIQLSHTSPGGVTGSILPPTISLYNFAINQADLKIPHRELLFELGTLLKLVKLDLLQVRIMGHTDASGNEAINAPLSQHRAQAVQTLLSRLAGTTIEAGWAAARQPIASNNTVEGRSRNRRVDIHFLVAPAGIKPPPSGRPPEKKETEEWFCRRHPLICLALGLAAVALWLCLRDPLSCLLGGPDEPTSKRGLPTVFLPKHIRGISTPKEMTADRIPPRVDTPMPVVVSGWESTMPPITLSIEGSGPGMGTVTINGHSIRKLQATQIVQLRGVQQTAEGRGGYLELVARFGTTKLASTNPFAVSAIPQDISFIHYASLIGADRGIAVPIYWQSDSGHVADLDKVKFSEVVEVDPTKNTGCFVGIPTETSGYKPANSVPLIDTHSVPTARLISVGERKVLQTHKFKDNRAGGIDIPMRKSGFIIMREVVRVSPPNANVPVFQITTMKYGAATIAHGIASQAGRGFAIVVQPVSGVRHDGVRHDGLLPEVAATTEEKIARLIEDSNPDFRLTRVNALRILKGPQEGSVPLVAGRGERGADVVFTYGTAKRGVVRLGREVKCINGGFNSFRNAMADAIAQLTYTGGQKEIFVQMPAGTDVLAYLRQFPKYRSAQDLEKYRRVPLVVVDPGGATLYEGPLLR